MFAPDDSTFDEISSLAGAAKAAGLRDDDRPRWRALVALLLGEVSHRGDAPERRRQLRAPMEVAVDVIGPEEAASLTTTSIGAGGVSLRILEALPLGMNLDLSIKLEGRKLPVSARAQVVYSRPGQVGTAFVDVFQRDREIIEATAVTALLTSAQREREPSP